MKCFGGYGRDAIDGKATCGEVRCGSTTGAPRVLACPHCGSFYARLFPNGRRSRQCTQCQRYFGMNLAESIAAILSMHEGRMLRARVALLELAEELETCSRRGRPDLDEPSERIRAIANELAAPTREPGACPNHPAAETLEIVSCVVCGAWKPSKDSPLVYIGSDGVHRAVRSSPTPLAPAPDEPDDDPDYRAAHTYARAHYLATRREGETFKAWREREAAGTLGRIT